MLSFCMAGLLAIGGSLIDFTKTKAAEQDSIETKADTINDSNYRLINEKDSGINPLTDSTTINQLFEFKSPIDGKTMLASNLMVTHWVWNGPITDHPYLPSYENTPTAYNGASIEYIRSTTRYGDNYTELESYFQVYYLNQTYTWHCITRFFMNGTYTCYQFYD